MITRTTLKPVEKVLVLGAAMGKTAAPASGLVHYRPSCPVVVHASVNDELPDRNEPRYA